MTGTGIRLLILFLLFNRIVSSQNLEFKLYSKSLREIEEKNYKGALKSMSQFVKFFPASSRLSEIYCNRAFVNTELNLFNEAVDDYYSAQRYDSLNPEIYKMRGNLYFKNKNYTAALKDYNHALRVDSAYGEPYALKAKVYQQQGSNELACNLYLKALQHGYSQALKSIQTSCDTGSKIYLRYGLQLLDLKSNDSDYGYSEFKPIKVGGNTYDRLEKYLSLLRDKNGYPISYNYLNTCCPYKSSNGTFGKSLCESYEIIFNNERRVLYLSLYDYDEPRVPVGLYSVYHFQE